MNEKNPVAVQLVTFRTYSNLNDVLAAVRETGFSVVETVGRHLEDAEKLSAQLKEYGLKAPSGHVSMADLRSRFEWVMNAALALGIRDLFMPAVAEEKRWSQPASEWRALGVELGEMAVVAAAHGIRLGYHNHNWEFAPYDDGSLPVEHFFAGADGSPLTWQADYVWIKRGHADPMIWVERYKHLLVSIHMKDEAIPPIDEEQRGLTAVGHGTMNWEEITPRLTSLNPSMLWVIEHERAKHPVDFCRDSRAFFSTLQSRGQL